ncbi:MAG: hypothetical protein ABSF92_06780 [Candidatus Acidiferrales bacterium]|jgi:hypothetical protein
MPTDPQSTGTGQAPALDPTSLSTALTVDDVKNVIAQAQAGAADPVTIGMQIFNNLGATVTVSGDVLRQALAASNIATDGPLSALLAAAQSITKAGSQVTVSNSQEIQTELSGTSIKFKQQVTFEAGTDGGFPTLSNIQGAQAHKVFWLNITEIQLRQDQGQRILHVATSGGARDFPLS